MNETFFRDYPEIPFPIRLIFQAELANRPTVWLAGDGAVRVWQQQANVGIWAGEWRLYCTSYGARLLDEILGKTYRPEFSTTQSQVRHYQLDDKMIVAHVDEKFSCPHQVLGEFDLSIDQLLCSGGGFLFGGLAWMDLRLSQFHLVGDASSPIEQDRIDRYVSRGFRFLGRA